MEFVRSFVFSFVLCGQGFSLLWTPVLRPLLSYFHFTESNAQAQKEHGW